MEKKAGGGEGRGREGRREERKGGGGVGEVGGADVVILPVL